MLEVAFFFRSWVGKEDELSKARFSYGVVLDVSLLDIPVFAEVLGVGLRVPHEKFRDLAIMRLWRLRGWLDLFSAQGGKAGRGLDRNILVPLP